MSGSGAAAADAEETERKANEADRKDCDNKLQKLQRIAEDTYQQAMKLTGVKPRLAIDMHVALKSGLLRVGKLAEYGKLSAHIDEQQHIRTNEDGAVVAGDDPSGHEADLSRNGHVLMAIDTFLTTLVVVGNVPIDSSTHLAGRHGVLFRGSSTPSSSYSCC